MKRIATWLAQTAVVLTLNALAQSSAENAAVLKGTTVDDTGHPVANADLAIYSFQERWGSSPTELRVSQRTVTDAAGGFVLEFTTGQSALVLARKPGLASAWRRIDRPPAEAITLVLLPPTVLAGVVLDEHEQPVNGAEVSVGATFSTIVEQGGGHSYHYLSDALARECYRTKTDADGRFRIEAFPTNSSANLVVRLPGKALRQPTDEIISPDSLPYHAGQQDIRLVLEPAGTIEGRIVATDPAPVLPAARLTLVRDGPAAFGMAMDEPTIANADGSFRIPNVGAGNYRLHAAFGTNTPPDWVAEHCPVAVETGQTTPGIELRAIRGELLEVLVLELENRQTLPDVTVHAYHPNYLASAISDAAGIARLRLPPGEYQLAAQKEKFASANTSASVGPDLPNRVELELEGPRKVKGVARRPDGQPAAGLNLRIVGHYGPDTPAGVTDKDGKFELEWNPRLFQGQQTSPCLLLRDAERNLALAYDLEADSNDALELNLEPAMSIAGHAECHGNPVTNTTAALIFWTGNHGMHLQDIAVVSHLPGHFEIRALPTGRRYGLQVSAPGHGQTYVSSIDSEEPKRVELDPIELKPAILQLAGQVVDANDQPVSGANVQLYGEGQPSHRTWTDSEGRFSFAEVCEGRAQLFANARATHGSTSAEGGDTNVVLRLGETAYAMDANSVPRRLKGTVTDPDNLPVAGAQVAVFPFTESRRKTDANGAFELTFQLQPWQVQSGGDPCLVIRDPARNLAAAEFLTEESTNVTIQLQPALTLTGRVEGTDGSPLAQAQIGVWLLACRTYNQLDEQLATTDASGNFQIKTVPPAMNYTVFATAKGHGRQQQEIEPDSNIARHELQPFILKPANQIVAGQVIDDQERPVSGAHVSVSGDDQPDASATTDSKGRFRLMVCEGQVRLFVGSDNAYANISADPGDTNLLVQLTRSGYAGQDSPTRAALRGKPLPDLATVGLAPDAVPAGQPLLLCLFDVEQRPSRRAIRLLADQYTELTAKRLAVVAVQAAVASDESFNQWQSASPPPFPVGRVLETSPQTRWATEVQSLPWLILTDARGQVALEGFSLDELNTHLETLR